LSATSAICTTSGDGSFDNANNLTAVYTAGASDLSGGSVTLTLTTDDPSGPCSPVSDQLNLTIATNPATTVEAGEVQRLSPGATASVVAGKQLDLQWHVFR